MLMNINFITVNGTKMSRDGRTARRFYRANSVSNLLLLMDRGLQAQEENRWTFEIAWEVANKGKFSKTNFF